ncbi:LPXTG cell wall anchor domain-containing protein [Pseudogracilibacillus sp. SE30717A]|uniref:LPXTG cell wall anchor domain-containing protein n=1 Tax=Pseudogracilibacillus sp. SE30717A TaxID=3098293 RepID=UPI00300E094A
MLKKISTFMLILMLTFSPVAPFTATAQEAEDTEVAEEGTETDQQVDEEVENTDSTQTEESVADEAEEADAVESEEVETADEVNPVAEENEEELTEQEVVNEEEEVEEVQVSNEEEEELNLRDVFGRASGDIVYDFNKGHYVLNLRAGITNFHTTQEIKNKWVAFTIPNGVKIGQDLPSGVIPIYIAGKTGLAVKIPNVPSSGSEHVNKQISLAGVENDNDPNVNMYLLDVDVDSNSYEEIGELRGQREIDFSVMEENPTIDLHGSITGSTTYDESKKYHFLNVNVKALNQTDSKVNDLYVAFELPENVEVVNDDNTPANMEILNLEGGKAVALKLPDLEQGKEGELTYRIPVVGVSDAVVTSETISVFKILDAGYNPIGQFVGHINVDFSGMDIAWHFDAIAQIITDYPGVTGNQVGFNFKYSVKNINIADVEKVTMEFIVPDGIKILKPEYNSGSRVEVDWKGNLATLTFGDLGGASGYEGYFTAVGETNKSINELKSMEVKVTLYRDGDTIVETINVPFEVGKYADIGLPIDEEPSTGGGDGGDGTTEPSPGTGNGNNGNGGSGTTGNDGKGNNGGNQGTNDDVKVTVEDGDDTVKDGDDAAAKASDKGDGSTLPRTATNMYSYMLIGAITLIAGASLLVFRRKNTIE